MEYRTATLKIVKKYACDKLTSQAFLFYYFGRRC